MILAFDGNWNTGGILHAFIRSRMPPGGEDPHMLFCGDGVVPPFFDEDTIILINNGIACGESSEPDPETDCQNPGTFGVGEGGTMIVSPCC